MTEGHQRVFLSTFHILISFETTMQDINMMDWIPCLWGERISYYRSSKTSARDRRPIGAQHSVTSLVWMNVLNAFQLIKHHDAREQRWGGVCWTINTRPLLHGNIITQAFIDIFDVILKCPESMMIIGSANHSGETVKAAVTHLNRQFIVE